MPLLIQDKPVRDFKTIDQLQETLNKETIQTVKIDGIASISYKQRGDGVLQLEVGGRANPVTQTAFVKLCSLLKAPARFLVELPFENISKDLLVRAFKTEEEKINLILKDDVIIGLSTREEVLTTRELLENTIPSIDKNCIRNISLVNERMFLSFVRSKESPLPGDQIETGLTITHDDSGGLAPAIDYYFYRLACSNGAVVKEIMKIAKFSNRMSKVKTLDLYKNRIEQSLDHINSIICTAIGTMSASPIPAEEKRFISDYLGFKNREDGLNLFQSKVHNNPAATYYDLMNFITDFAKSFDPIEKRIYESLGGNMILHFREFNKSVDLFPKFTEFKRQKLHEESQVN